MQQTKATRNYCRYNYFNENKKVTCAKMLSIWIFVHVCKHCDAAAHAKMENENEIIV